jgi:hypothetical protein
LPKPLFSRQTVFSIPYRIDPPAPGSRAPVEVQLHVSENRGPWRLHSKVPPSQTNFTFRAAGDGDYWFMVRTLDERGQLQPPGAPAPELWVIVDTEPPTLELSVQRGTAGELRARWRANDKHLRPESMKLEYQVAGSPAWQPVAIDRPRGAAESAAQSGEATWIAGSTGQAVVVRGEIADAAGNVVKNQQTVSPARDMPQERTADRREVGPRDRQPMLPPEPPWRERTLERNDANSRRGTRWEGEPSDGGPLTGGRSPEGRERPAGRDENRASAARPVSEQPPLVGVAQDRRRFEEVLPPPLESARPQGAGDSRTQVFNRAARQPEESTLPDGPDNARRRGQQTRRELAADDGGPMLGAADSTARPIVRRTLGPNAVTETGSGVTSERIEPPPVDQARAVSGAAPPPGVRPRMVNSPRFELEYDIESVGPAGIAKVELWATRDGGRTWTSYGIDPDNRSPMSVTVAGEGMYGFRIVVESGAGLRGAPPASGDEPEIWIGVDTNKPEARLTTAELGGGDRSGELTIHWEASDAMPAARPVALSYSPTPGGPWTTVAAGLANSGSYTWRLDNRVPDRVYLRLEVRDEAGNVQSFEAADPVSLDPVRPRGVIRGVRPVTDTPSARGPQWYYNLR